MNGNRHRSRRVAAGVLALTLAGAAIIVASPLFRRAPVDPPAPPESADLPRQVHTLCAACHAYPPAASFPRSAWRRDAEQGYDFDKEFHPDLPPPPLHQAIDYYEPQAPTGL